MGYCNNPKPVVEKVTEYSINMSHQDIRVTVVSQTHPNFI